VQAVLTEVLTNRQLHEQLPQAAQPAVPSEEPRGKPSLLNRLWQTTSEHVRRTVQTVQRFGRGVGMALATSSVAHSVSCWFAVAMKDDKYDEVVKYIAPPGDKVWINLSAVQTAAAKYEAALNQKFGKGDERSILSLRGPDSCSKSPTLFRAVSASRHSYPLLHGHGCPCPREPSSPC
jgi:hypothetical protein